MDTTMHDVSRRWHVVAGFSLLAIAALYFFTIREGHDWGDDFAMYVHHALNIVQGKPYAETGYIYNPDNPVVGPKAYPPGFPLMLTPAAYFYGLDLEAFKVLTLFWSMLGFLAIYWCLQQEIDPRVALGIVVLLGTNPWFWEMRNEILSDLPFLGPLYLALGLMARSYRVQVGWKAAVILGVVLWFAGATRVVGLLLVPAFLVNDLVRLRTIRRTTLASLAIFGVLFLAQRQIIQTGGGYFDQFELNWRAYLHNAIEYVKCFTVLFSGLDWKPAVFGVGVVAMLLAAVGFLTRLWRNFSAWEEFFLLNIALLIVWPGFGGTRLMVPVLPLFLFYAAVGFEVALKKAPRVKFVEPVLLLVFVIVNLLWINARITSDALPEGVHLAESREMFRYVQTETPSESVFAAPKPRALALFTGRKSTAVQIDTSWRRVEEHLKQSNVRFYLVSPGSIWGDDDRVLHLYLNDGSKNHRVYSNSKFLIVEK